MKKRERLEMADLVQEIQMLIDDWHFTKCPGLWKCDKCTHYKLCKCLLDLSDINVEKYNSNGELRK